MHVEVSAAGLIGEDEAVADQTPGQAAGSTPGPGPGKRAGARRGARPERTCQPRLLGLAVGGTVLVVAWGYLVYAAIDFGQTARGGEPAAWAFLGIASVGAVACLFVGLILVARLLRVLGIGSASGAGAPEDSTRPAGRRRAAR